MLDYIQFRPFKIRTSSRNKMRIVNKSGILTHSTYTRKSRQKETSSVCKTGVQT